MRLCKFYKVFLTCCSFLLVIALTGCSTETPGNGGAGEGAWLIGFRQNEHSVGSAPGYVTGSIVRVSIRLEEGNIKFNRTPANYFGIRGIDAFGESDFTVVTRSSENEIRNVVERRNSFDGITRFMVDGAVGNTVTMNAVLNAGRQALENLRD